MLRIAVVHYLVAVILAGPWLCCCTVARVAASATEAQSPVEQPPADSCCCCRQEAENEPGPEEGPAQPRPPDRQKCPCHQGSSGALAPAVDAAKASHLRHAVDGPGELLLFVEDDRAPNAVPALAARKHRVLPFLTSSDILHALHILRC